MVALDSSYPIPAEPVVRPESGHAGWFVVFALLISLAIAASAVIADSQYGWREGAELVQRFSLILFALAMMMEPLSRIFPRLAPVGRERASLTLAFAMAQIVSLACVAAPSQMGPDKLTPQALVYCAFTGMIVAVMLFSAHPATRRVLGGPVWRTMQRISTTYFWLAFALIGLDHLSGPHRPDAWYGVSLLLLTAALLIRFTDSFLAKLRHRATAPR